MTERSLDKWNKRYRESDHHLDKEPSELLVKWEPNFPTGRVLDLACGAGRNSIFLAGKGYSVDALDFSEEALKIAEARAKDQNLHINWIRADLKEYKLPKEAYDVVVNSYFHPKDRISMIKNSLKWGGFILLEHHITTEEPEIHGPSSDNHRFKPNELLHLFSDFQILYYEEGLGYTDDGRKFANARIVARKVKEPEKQLPENNSSRK